MAWKSIGLHYADDWLCNFASLKLFSQIICEQCRSYLIGIKNSRFALFLFVSPSFARLKFTRPSLLIHFQFITICLGIVLSTQYIQTIGS